MGIGFFNFSDIDPAKVGDGTGSAVADGFYVGRLVSALIKPAKTGTPQLEAKVAVVGGVSDGAERTGWQTLPTEGMDAQKRQNLRNIWVRIFQSFGFTPEEIKNFGDQVTAENIPAVLMAKGGQCFFQWENGNKDLQEKASLSFVTQAKYQKEQEAAAAAATARVGAPSAIPGVSVIAPGAGAAPVVPGMPAPGAAMFAAPPAAPAAPVMAPTAPAAGFPFPGAAPAAAPAPGFPFPGAAPAAGAPNPVLAAMGIRQ